METARKLEGAVAPSRLGPPALKVWIGEGLEKAARQAWQESHTAYHDGRLPP